MAEGGCKIHTVRWHTDTHTHRAHRDERRVSVSLSSVWWGDGAERPRLVQTWYRPSVVVSPGTLATR